MKCELAGECKGNGKCCAFCDYDAGCNLKCQMDYIMRNSKEDRQKEATMCDWFSNKED